MSRKHFVAIAKAIAAISNADERRRTAELLAQVCANSNQNFNRSRFLVACGVEK